MALIQKTLALLILAGMLSITACAKHTNVPSQTDNDSAPISLTPASTATESATIDLSAPVSIEPSDRPTALRANLPAGTKIHPAYPNRLITQLAFSGKASNMTDQVIVTLPLHYGEDPTRTYPVIFIFPGYPSKFEKFQDHIEPLFPGLIGGRKLSDVIVVYPNVYPGNLDTECVNGADGKQYETWIAEDIVNWVKKNLFVNPDPRFWATWGLSAGGWCAAMIASKHPEIFSVAVSLGGYFQLLQTPGQIWRKPDDPDYDLSKYLSKAPTKMIYLGAADDTESFSHAMKAKNWVTDRWVEHIYPTGGHTWGFFGPAIQKSLELLGSAAPQFIS